MLSLSDAIRKGAKYGPQLYSTYLHAKTDDGSIGSCALGAAWLGAGKTTRHTCNMLSMKVLFPQLLRRICSCPMDCSGPDLYDVARVVTHLNDHHRWTREAIADWVARLEPEQTPAVVEEPELELVC
jgi:hypothetical protein